MLSTNYIRCHGSGNRFLLLDAAAEPRLESLGEHPALVSRLCTIDGPTDGLLLVVRRDGGYGMRMFNTDGSEAEMCGNGIRCVARLVAERYLRGADAFDLWSGGRRYAVRCEEPIFAGLPTIRVELPIRLASEDFPPSLACGAEGFVGRPIEALDPELRFTYLNLGNPHLAAAVDKIDTARLARLGERVKELSALFPRGINVSLFVPCGGQEIFTATCERGVGITSSCGTAMTSCATAAALLGLCGFDAPVEVWNRGGRVRCLPRRTPQGLVTRLTGDATFEAAGTLRLDGRSCIADDSAPLDAPGDRLRMASETRRELNETYGLTIADQ